ncbi:Hypothetical predicted protein [Mytilus galloprovincialis]|uniref:TIR domain-containing protein n=1 Tax=Mytilus galloprovincialis TaxID=29158 RepID=A0A8B6DW96_MYTGA|nr:Hypothetical predicted protein [Mytilus galloprovincialis]
MSDSKTLEKLELDVPIQSATHIIFGDGYKYLKHLSSLNIGRCYYPVYIDAKTFQFLPRLTNISFDNQCKMFIILGGHQSLQSIRQFYVHSLVLELVQDLLHFNSLTNELKLTPLETLSFENTFSGSFEYYPWNPISLNLKNSSLKYLRMTDINRLGESFPPSKLYPPPPSLQELNLSSNKLEKFALDLVNIRNLSLQNNYLGRFLINLQKNALRCTCNTLPFIKWISKMTVDLLLNEKCNLEDGTGFSFYPINSLIQQVQKGCTSYTTLVIALSVGLAVMLIVIVLALVYKYRWKLRYMFYLAKSKHYRYKASSDDGNYTYDAFISYCDDDRSFVLKNCIENLETEGNVKLCVHQRDFLPGQEITVNITNAIHDSRKTVCIITRKFLSLTIACLNSTWPEWKTFILEMEGI